MPNINNYNKDELLKNKQNIFEVTHIGATFRLSMKYLRSAFKRNRVAELTTLNNLPLEKIIKILSEKFNIKISSNRIKSLPPIDPGNGIDHGYIKTLGKYKHGNRVIIKFISRIQEGFYFNFYYEAFYRVTIYREENVLLDMQNNFNVEVSPDWRHVMNVVKKIPENLKEDLGNIKL